MAKSGSIIMILLNQIIGTAQQADNKQKPKAAFGFGGKLFAGTRGFDPV